MMRFSLRVLAVMVLFLLVGMTAFADDEAKSKGEAKKSETTSTAATAPATDAAAAKPQPGTSIFGSPAKPAPPPYSSRSESTPAADLFLGFSYIRLQTNTGIGPFPITTTAKEHFDMYGGTGAIAGNVNNWFAMVGEVSGYKIVVLPAGVSGRGFTYLGGPRFTLRKNEKLQPFVHTLTGLIHVTSEVSPTAPSPTGSAFFGQGFHDTSFAWVMGGGLDIVPNPHWAIRLFQVDYLFTKLPDNASHRQDNLRASGGIVFRFGGGAEEAPVSATCSVDRSEVWAGEAVKASVSPRNFNAKHNLNYDWTTNGGKVEGRGNTVTINTAGVSEGQSYFVSVHVTDPKNTKATTNCQSSFATKRRLPPTISCSANPGSVVQGGSITIHSDAGSPQGGAVAIAVTSDCGVSGQGTDVSVDTSRLQPGSCSVQCAATDDHQLTSSTSTSFNVQAPPPPPPPPPPPTAIEQRLALHSIYFVTAQPTVQNPSAGLILSQQRTLIPLAEDFKKYLEYKPDARLILEGHADPRGGVEYNQGLSERRVARTKAFLVEHGVPAANIETKGFGKQKNMTDAEVRQAVNNNPDITAEERARILRNERVIILASNRRVDVTLNATGQANQESIRHFPFNAEDALTLIGGREKPKPAAKPAPRRARPAPGKVAPGKARRAPVKKAPQ